MAKTLPTNLRNRIRIEQPIETRNEYGEVIKTWQQLAEVFANVRFQNGAQVQRNAADYGESRLSVRIRFRRDVDNTMRLVLLDWHDEIVAIEAVLPDAVQRKYMDLVCIWGRNNGE